LQTFLILQYITYDLILLVIVLISLATLNTLSHRSIPVLIYNVQGNFGTHSG